jgi:hypothetical protein
MLFGTSGVLVLALQLAGSASATDAAVKVGRSAQERFEITRRAHLPRLRATSGRPCDAIVGRYCYWYDSTESKPIPEPARIATARRTLIALLDSLAARNPDNDWITGQRVRYTIEGGDAESALRAARSCEATGWWCAALEGLTHHVAERYAAADTAFERALAFMPDEQRCDWIDLRRLVAHTMTRDFSDASCAKRREKAERLWTVSQPLWSVAGNDLRTEHFARHTMALLLARSANPHGMAWSNDSRELVIRYGWSEWFSRAEPSLYQTTPGAVTGHDREPSYFVFPRTTSTRAPIDQSSWAFRDALMPMRYSPRHIEWLGELFHQLVRFPRGDSMRVLAIARVRDSALTVDSVELTLGALLDQTITTSRGRSVATLDVSNDSMLVSVEAVGTTSRRAERARYSIGALPCARRCLSDLLLFSADDTDAAPSLDSATQRALTGSDVSASRPLGVYWEVGDGAHADVLRDSVVWASVTVEPERISAARRLAARMRIASVPTAVKLRWRLALSRSGSVTLRLPANAHGRYRVRLSIDGVGSSERMVALR